MDMDTPPWLHKIDAEKSQRTEMARSLVAERNAKAKNDTRLKKATYKGGLGKSSDAMSLLLNHSMADFKVDGKNTPYRWKDRRRLEEEATKEGSLSRTKKKGPSPFQAQETRSFPEALRSKTAEKVQDSDSIRIVYANKMASEPLSPKSPKGTSQSSFLDDKDFLPVPPPLPPPPPPPNAHTHTQQLTQRAFKRLLPCAPLVS